MSTPEDPRAFAQKNSLQSDVQSDVGGTSQEEQTTKQEAPADTAAPQADPANDERTLSKEERILLRAARIRAARALTAAQSKAGASSEADLRGLERRKTARLRAKSTPPSQRVLPGIKLPERVFELKPLPQEGRKKSLGVVISFFLCVFLPVVAASIYYYGYASKQYVAGFQFVVRDAQSAVAASSGTSLPSLMGMGGGSNSVENYMVADYLQSREAVQALQQKLDLVKLYSHPDIDWIARLDPTVPIESVVAYWRRMTTASYDQIKGLGSVEIRAFTPHDAYLIATTLVQLSEELVNNVANRPQQDAVRAAEDDIKRAEERLKKVRAELARYRNAEQLIEPGADVVTGKVTLAQTLRASLAALETEASVLKAQNLSPNAPQSIGLQNRIKSTREQLRLVESQVSVARDGSTPLSKIVAEYESLDQERQFAQALVSTAQQNFEQARGNAIRQHIYVNAFVKPAEPQSSTYPKRTMSILLVALGCLLFWTIGLLIIGSVREHLT